jgi:predicted S18 family serine protease
VSRRKGEPAETAAERGTRLQRECVEVSALLEVVMKALHNEDEGLANEIIVLRAAEQRIARLSEELDCASVSGGLTEQQHSAAAGREGA